MKHVWAVAMVPGLVLGTLWDLLRRTPFDAEAELRAKYPDLYVRHWTDGTDQ